MMDKLVITRWRDKVLTAVFSGRKPLALTLEPEQGGSLLNNIYIGKVQKVVKISAPPSWRSAEAGWAIFPWREPVRRC